MEKPVPLWGLRGSCCATPLDGSARICQHLYLSYDTPPKKPVSATTPHLVDRNQQIRDRYDAGESLSDLAKAFGISPQRISQIIHGRRKQPKRDLTSDYPILLLQCACFIEVRLQVLA